MLMNWLVVFSLLMIIISSAYLNNWKAFKILWNSETKPGTWISFEIKTLGCPLMFTFSRNGYAKQWFCNMNIFPIAISKDNSSLMIGISLIKLFIGFNFHLNFHSGFPLRKKRQKDINIRFTPLFN